MFRVIAGAYLALSLAESKAANPPAGTDGMVTISEDIPYTFAPGDFGFTDPNDLPGNQFNRVVIASLPALGSLQLDGRPVAPGQPVSMNPVPGIAWTAGNTGRNWWRVASSSDGTKLAAVQLEGQIFVSSDSGATWTAREVNRKWVGITSSADGSKLAAIVTEGQIYTSVDSGTTWTARENNRNWVDIASSADGLKLVAVVNNGRIFTSSNSGVSWSPRADSRYWFGVASSADGSRLVAFPYEGGMYVSADSGVSWIDRGNVKFWYDVASSADGSHLVGVVGPGNIHKSTDYGATWHPLESAGIRNWRAVASSADGSRLAAVDSGFAVDSGRIHISTDSGTTWVERGLSRQWGAIAASADGAKLVALEEAYGTDSQIHQSSATVPQLAYTPAANAFGASNSFTFKVGDDGGAGMDLDPTPNTLTLNVVNVNDPPIGPERLPDQSPDKGVPFSYQFPANTFTDADPGTVLTYAASWQNGGALPPWLTFDGATRTFSGTPGSGDEGTFRVVVTASDQGSPPLSSSTYFMIRISTDAPVGTDRVLTLDEDTPYTFNPADYGFTDPQDSPPNTFTGVILTSLPTAGTLTVEGTAVAAGTTISMLPESQLNWTPRNAGTNLSQVASSADGMKLAAISGNQATLRKIYISTDTGVTWTPTESLRQWRGIASSADGTKLVAVSLGLIYTSTDSGLTWSGRAHSANWSAVTSSADGTKLAATVTQGHIYISADSGLTWTAVADELNWSAVASSADGTRLIAAENAGQLYTSSDSGATWTPRETSRFWRSVASSSDGRKLVAAGNNSGGFPGRIYTSTDAGVTWTARDSERNWTSVASSEDGSRLVAVASSDRIYTSRDAGVTWLARELSRNWTACASSADGTKLIATASAGSLYTSVDAVPLLKFTPAANASGSPYASFLFQVEDDGTGALTRDPIPRVMTLNVSPVNDAPTVAVPIPDQIVTERTGFNFRLPATTFRDTESDTVLTYTARQANDSPLPAWLSFNVDTRTFSGLPGSADAAFLDLKVIATDNGSPPLSVPAPFLLTITNNDEAPTGSPGAVSLTAGQSYQFGTADFGFSDPADFPPNRFTRVRFTTLPGAGVLSVDGVPAQAGSYASIAPAALGTRWTARAQPRFWYAMASSTDGVKLVAVTNPGFIYTSTDSGLTWTARDSSRPWRTVASSSDGKRLVAGETSGRIYVSADSGLTWTPRNLSGAWYGLASSADGAKLAAASFGGQIHTSTDFGATWTMRASLRDWYYITSSSDGSKLAATVRGGQIYTSADSGASWIPRESSRFWRSITSSADGTRLAAIVQTGRIYISNDSGLTWNARETNRNWYDISSSADGMLLAAVVQNGRVHISTDSGLTWKAQETSRTWRCICVSPDGGQVAATGDTLLVYLSTPLPAQTVTYTPPAGGNLLFADISFQVEDDGLPGSNLDLSPEILRLNYPQTPFQAWAIQNNLSPDPTADAGIHLIHFASGLQPDGNPAGGIAVTDGVISTRGLPSLLPPSPPAETSFGALFGRRKDSGLIYQVQFSADLISWQSALSAPAVLADDGVMEACVVRFPSVLDNGKTPRFFRVSVTPL